MSASLAIEMEDTHRADKCAKKGPSPRPVKGGKSPRTGPSPSAAQYVGIVLVPLFFAAHTRQLTVLGTLGTHVALTVPTVFFAFTVLV